SDDELDEMAESIKQIGVREPILVREMPADARHPYKYYQILNGRNRTEASRRANMEDIPAIIEHVSDAEAQYIISTTTLMQRQDLKISTKAWAYRMQMEAIFLIETDGKFTVPPGDSMGIRAMAQQVSASKTSIARYLRLTYLTEGLLDLIDNSSIPMKAGVELSYLAEDEQDVIHAYLIEHRKSISVEAAEQLREYHNSIGEITHSVVNDLLGNSKGIEKLINNTLTFARKDVQRISNYIPIEVRGEKKQAADYVIQALRYYKEHVNQNNSQN
ncbi:MAG: ParB N-terminal domain-containing protein, partial [Angelakisella sp.]